MTLTVLSVAYPLALVGPDAVGGAEQVLAELDLALTRAGCRSIVIACKGSRVAGTLIGVPPVHGTVDERLHERARERHRCAILAAIERWPVDVVHLHGLDFPSYLPPSDIPALATLHLPIDWYPAAALAPQRPNTWFNCVSGWQHARCPKHPGLLGPIENGVGADYLRSRRPKRRFTLMLSRICPEKGVHLAIEAAKRADIPLLIAGEVSPYSMHQQYFEEQVRPQLDRWRRFIGPVGRRCKRRLLAAARCVLVPSLANETASLVAREALASGTPVVAFARGALTETVEHGRTGFLVDDVAEMADAIRQAPQIEPDACRRAVRHRFTLHQMIARYFELYQFLGRTSHPSIAAGAP